MRSRTQRRTPWIARLGLLTLAVAVAGGGFAYWSRLEADSDLEIPTAPVRRVTLSSTVTEGGEVDSSEKTLIECQLENVSFRSGGGRIEASGSSVIIELVPEGTMVKKGDVICRLNSAEYEELVRQQLIELEEDLADLEAARLDLETLQIQLREYRDGLYLQEQERLRAQIAMAEADVQRQQDRLVWSERMTKIGYMTESQLGSERNMMLQTQIALNQANIAYKNLVRYTSARTLIELQSQIDGAEAQFRSNESRVEHDRESLARYQQQVEYCTIRAPHDGFLIYTHEDDDDAPIELGASVREDQDLFFLPDLTKMEVRVKVHESAVNRVKPGQPARVRVEALPDALVEGEVVFVSPLPMSVRSRRQSDEIKNYEARVKLHVIPEGLMPGMTAEVEVLTSHQPNALVIPPRALAVEDGRNVCYVATLEGVERRPVTIGEYHPNMIQVVDGLEEGELVVVDLRQIDPDTVFVASDGSTLGDDAVAALPSRGMPPL